MGTSGTAAGSNALDRWPLVGRADELMFARTQVANGGSVVIAGDPGVGKTRLARELLTSSGAEGCRTEWAVGTVAARPIPFGALAHLVSPDAVGGGREATLRAITEGLRQRDDGPILLGVDDAHLLDGVSAVLVHQLVSQGIALVVLTVRSGEPVPDPVLGLWKNDLATRVELQTLSRAETIELLRTALGGEMDGAALHMLWELSRGNVLFLRQLVLHGLESGALRRDEHWHWHGSLDPGQRLRDVVGSRIGRLDDAELDALEVIAVGEPVPARFVPELISAGAVARLERRGLVRSSHEPSGIQLRLAHPLFGEVVRAEAPVVRSTEIRRRLADAFQAHDVGQGQSLRVATWRAEIGDRSDPRVLVEGARRAWAVGEVDLVERLARLALGSTAEFEASYLLGKALVGEGRFEEAVQTWQAAEHRPATDAQRAALAAALAQLLLWGLGRPGDADDTVGAAAQRVEDPVARHELDALRSLLGAISARTAEQRIEQATAVLRDPSLSSRLRANATLVAVTAWTEGGHLELAVRAASEAVAAAEARSGGTPATMLRTSLADALWPAGRIDEAEAVASAGYAHALEHADHRRGIWCRLLGSIALVRGHARAAVMWLEEGQLALGEGQDQGFLRGVRIRLSMAATLLGDLALADRSLEGTASSDALFARGWDLELARACAWLCMARGERSAALRQAEDGARAAAGREHWTVEAFILHDLTRFGEPLLAADRLHELAEVVDGPLVRAMAAHARGLLRSEGVALDAAAAEFAGLGCDLFAAEAAAAAGAAHRRAGRRSSAAASVHDAHAWRSRCEGVRTPALALAEIDDGLTRREREVATLAARHLSDQQIAEQLYLSIRTVQSHLYAAYGKLGVSGRHDLRAVLDLDARAGG